MNSLTDKQIDELLTDKQIDEFLEFFFYDWYFKEKAAGTYVYDGAEDKKVKAFFFGYGDLTTKELVTMIGSLGQIPGEQAPWTRFGSLGQIPGCQLTELQIAELKAKILGWEKYASCTMTVNDLGHFLKTLGGQTPKSIPFEVEEPAPAEDDSAGSFNSPRNRNVTNRAPDQPSSPEEDFSTWYPDDELEEGPAQTDDENLVQKRARLLQERLAVDPDWLEKELFGGDSDEETMELFGTDKKDDKKDEDLVSLM
jgi:hypothetical protein